MLAIPLQAPTPGTETSCERFATSEGGEVAKEAVLGAGWSRGERRGECSSYLGGSITLMIAASASMHARSHPVVSMLAGGHPGTHGVGVFTPPVAGTLMRRDRSLLRRGFVADRLLIAVCFVRAILFWPGLRPKEAPHRRFVHTQLTPPIPEC